MAPKRSMSLTIASTSSYRLTTQASSSGTCNTGACSRNCPNNGQVSQVLRNTSIIDGCASACACSLIGYLSSKDSSLTSPLTVSIAAVGRLIVRRQPTRLPCHPGELIPVRRIVRRVGEAVQQTRVLVEQLPPVPAVVLEIHEVLIVAVDHLAVVLPLHQ